MKLKIGKDLINNEHILVIPNQLTIVFDFAFTTMKLMTKEGNKIIDLEPNSISCTYRNARLIFDKYQFYTSQGFHFRSSDTYLCLNHNHIRNIIMFLIDNVPFDMANYDFEVIENVKEVKCYTNRIILLYNDNLGKTIKLNGFKKISEWQYYFKLRDIVNGTI